MVLPYRKFSRNPLRLLFSTDYSEFITTRVLTIGYRMMIVATVVTVAFWLWVAATLPEWIGTAIPALMFMFTPFLGIAFLCLVRVAFEYLLVVFDIAETLHKVDRKAEYLARVAHARTQQESEETRDAQTAHR